MNIRESTDFTIFQEIWGLYKKYYENPPAADADWEQVVKDADIIYKRYQDRRLAKDLVLTVLAELERREKQEKGNHHE